jgi:hypothetical protein
MIVHVLCLRTGAAGPALEAGSSRVLVGVMGALPDCAADRAERLAAR